METTWDKIKVFINAKEIGAEITRKELREAANITGTNLTADWYRRILEVTGYVVKIGRGKYKAVKKIEADLTTSNLRTRADLNYLLLTSKKQNEY